MRVQAIFYNNTIILMKERKNRDVGGAFLKGEKEREKERKEDAFFVAKRNGARRSLSL